MVEFKVSAITEQAIEKFKIVYERKNGAGSFGNFIGGIIDDLLNKEIQRLRLPTEENKCDNDEWILNQFMVAYEINKIKGQSSTTI